MKRISRTLLFSALALAMLAVAAPPSGAAGNGKAVERPYKTTGTGTLVVQPPEECDISAFPIVSCTFETSGTVIGTHVGTATTASTGVVTLDFAAPCEGRGGVPGVELRPVSDGEVVAADGSELWTHSEALGCFVDVDTGFDLVNVGTFVGGTGRFEGATGTTSIVSSTTDGITVSTTSGTLTY